MDHEKCNDEQAPMHPIEGKTRYDLSETFHSRPEVAYREAKDSVLPFANTASALYSPEPSAYLGHDQNQNRISHSRRVPPVHVDWCLMYMKS